MEGTIYLLTQPNEKEHRLFLCSFHFLKVLFKYTSVLIVSTPRGSVK